MSVNRNNLSISNSYNITGFSITPIQLLNEILSNGFKIKVDFKPDFRQQIADSWPKKINDSISTKDWGWKPKFGLKESIEATLK
jgi:nucleoside-diphosphate-sugar epimerase